MSWQEGYKDKLLTLEEAAKLVKSGDLVRICYGLSEPTGLCKALEARRDELRNVRIEQSLSLLPYGWFQEGWQDSFVYGTGFVMPSNRAAMQARLIDFLPFLPGMGYDKAYEEGRDNFNASDVFFVSVTPPDKHGYCSFGNVVWYSKSYARQAKTVVGEVNENLIRTYGDNFIHVSEIDYLVDHTAPVIDVTRLLVAEEAEVASVIGANAASLIKDGDTIQIGTGTVSTAIVHFLEARNDLGIHSEIIPPGIVGLVQKGVITGSKKTVHKGKAVASVVVAGPEDLTYIDNNPQFELYEANYVDDIRVISSHDNMVAVNNALSMDLTGQMTAESIGSMMWSGTGGQAEFTIGAVMSKGGRAITCIPSTAKGGTVSRIVPTLAPNTVHTIPRMVVDYVVTEYGIARLLGKTQRQRAEELISIAHPDFRAELRKEAQKLFGP